MSTVEGVHRLLAMEPRLLLAGLPELVAKYGSFRDGWWGVAEIARSNAKRLTPVGIEYHLDWAAVAIWLMDAMGSGRIRMHHISGFSDSEMGFQAGAMRLRVDGILSLGSVTPHPILDPEVVVNWFYENLFLTAGEGEQIWAERRQRHREIGVFGLDGVELDDTLERVNLVQRLVDAGLLARDEELCRWRAVAADQHRRLQGSPSRDRLKRNSDQAPQEGPPGGSSAGSGRKSLSRLLTRRVRELREQGPESIMLWLQTAYEHEKDLGDPGQLIYQVARRAATRGTQYLRRDWAQVTIAAYEQLSIKSGSGRTIRELMLASMRIRAYLIRDLGSVPGDPVLDAAAVTVWCRAQLSMSLGEARRVAGGKPVTAAGWMAASSTARERLREWMWMRKCLAVVAELERAGRLQPDGGLSGWIALLPGLAPRWSAWEVSAGHQAQDQ